MNDITFVVPCMGRLHYLKQTMLNVRKLFKYVLVDWSCPQKCGEWAKDKDVTVVSVPNQKYFNLSKARNVGARAVATRDIGFIDADMFLNPDFEKVLSLSMQDRFMIFEGKQEPGYSGFIVMPMTAFKQAEGYDEDADGYGVEDTVMRLKMYPMGLKAHLLPKEWASHLEHSDKLRHENYRDDQGHARNVARLMPNYEAWKIRHFGDKK